jgi:hypothetical protein
MEPWVVAHPYCPPSIAYALKGGFSVVSLRINYLTISFLVVNNFLTENKRDNREKLINPCFIHFSLTSRFSIFLLINNNARERRMLY